MAYLVHEGSNFPFRSRSFFLGPCGKARRSAIATPLVAARLGPWYPPLPLSALTRIKIRYDCWVSYLISHPTAASTGEQNS